MGKYLLKRLVYLIIVFLLLSLFMYLIYDAIPFDRAKNLTEQRKNQYIKDPDGPAKLEALYHEYRVELGYEDRDGNEINVMQRWLAWLGVMPIDGEFRGVLQGEFGDSYGNVIQPVMEVIKEPMKTTIWINILATILALGITIPLGIFCAVKKGSKRDTAIQVGSIIGYSMPTFITAILFIFLFAILIPLFPVSGMNTPGSPYSGIRSILDRLYYMCLPLIVMTFCSLGGMTRFVRASMIEALSMDCIRTARAKGLKERVVVYSHAWRNALIPIVTLVVGWFLGIFSGSVMIEQIFEINGMGRVYIQALTSNDNNVVLTLQMFYVSIALFGNLIIDILYGIIDPRIRVNK